MGPTSVLPPASKVRGQECHHSCHPLPERKEMQGQHRSTFRFCSDITQMPPAPFQLGQEPLNHKHVHAQLPHVLTGPLHPAVQVPHSPHPPQLTEKTWPRLHVSVVSWLLFLQPGVCLDVGIKVYETDCR